jgi:Asp-tRNA(Asn)/Glu-tRNA(Gln) amidotransferase A subunit family amidase
MFDEADRDTGIALFFVVALAIVVALGTIGIAVPAAIDAQGLPLGLQLIGRPFDEETLFSLGEVIERVAGRFTPVKWW